MSAELVEQLIAGEHNQSQHSPKLIKIASQDKQISILFSAAWPSQLDSPLVWKGSQFVDEKAYTYTFTQDEIMEIESALESFKHLGLDGHQIDRNNFLLPILSSRLDGLALELHQGKGFFALRGLNPNIYSPEDNILIFLGVSSYIGAERGKQNDDGHMLAHIKNARSKVPQQDRPIGDSNRPSHFHTDMFCNILAMQTRSLAAKGGDHVLSSAWNLYNELASTRPDILKLLSKPDWPFDHQSELFESTKRPLLHYHGGRVILNLVRESLVGIERVRRTTGFEITEEQHEALNIIQQIAASNQLVIKMQPGDLTFVNNFAILHSREAFEDSITQSRYHVRLWLRNPELAWKLPYCLRVGNERIYDGQALVENWNVQPLPRMRFRIAERLTP